LPVYSLHHLPYFFYLKSLEWPLIYHYHYTLIFRHSLHSVVSSEHLTGLFCLIF
jgi:hypothetical protein